MKYRYVLKRRKCIKQPTKKSCFGQPSKEDFIQAKCALNYDPNVMPEHNIRTDTEEQLYRLTETLENKWLKSLLFGCDHDIARFHSKPQAQLANGQSFFEPIFFSKHPPLNIAENYLKIAYIKHQQRHSNFSWEIDALRSDLFQALNSWRNAFRDWSKSNRLTMSGTCCKEYKFYESEKQYTAFHHSTLYLLSCFTNNPKEENINPAAVSNFLSFEYYKVREMWRAFLENYLVLQYYHEYVKSENNNLKHYSENMNNGYIFFRNPADNALVHKIYELFQKHLKMNHIPKPDSLDEMLSELIERTVNISQINTSYNFFLPHILSHIFSEFFTDSYEVEYTQKNDNQRCYTLFPDRETTFPTLKRMLAKHQKIHTEYISDEQYYVRSPNPLINFMEDAVASLFDFSYYLNIHILNDETREKYISHIQANWLAFYLENNHAYFENKTVCGEKSGCFLFHYLEKLFRVDAKQSLLSLDFRWIQRYSKYSSKKYQNKFVQIALDILFEEFGPGYSGPPDEFMSILFSIDVYFYDPELWESGSLLPKYEEDEAKISYINHLILLVQQQTKLSLPDAAELTRRAMLSVFFVPSLDVLESYLNNMYDQRKQMSLFLDLHIFEQKELTLNVSEEYLDIIVSNSKILTESAMKPESVMNGELHVNKQKFISS